MGNEFEERILFAEGDDDSKDDDSKDDDNKDDDDSKDDDSDHKDDDSTDDDDSSDDDDSKDDDSKDDSKDDKKKEDKKVEKPVETPEAKRARLKRQLAQHEKKHNFKSDETKDKKKARSSDSLSSFDTIALINAKVHTEDIQEVIEYAKFKGISIADALETSVIKTSLNEKAEQRATAEATNTGKSKSGNGKVTGETLLDKASKTGEIPDSTEGLSDMLDTRYDRKSKRK